MLDIISRITGMELDTVHQLRNTHQGVRYLKKSGRFKEYQAARLGLGRPFIAWDGEGWSDPGGDHHYMLWGNSEGDYIQAPSLGSRECLDLLLRSARENMTAKNQSTAIHIIFGGGYDATHILRDLPQTCRDELRDTGETVWRVAGTGGLRPNSYQIQYIPHKWLTVTGRDWHSGGKRTYVKLYDIMTFFQSSAIDAWESRGIEVPEVIKTGKAARGGFTWDDIEEVKTYWRMELEMYVLLADYLRQEFDEAGIHVRQFHGPGAVASAVFKQYGIKKHMQEPPSLEIEQACQHAYFGGRFEQFKAGHHAGPVYVYDINSAYPHRIRNLPSLAGAEWIKTDKYDPEALGVWFCQAEGNGDYLSPQPLPWRDKTGSVGYPATNKGVWLWHPEARNAEKVLHGWILQPATEEKPFAFVEDMYNKRRQWKAEGRGAEKALKLALNSLYGKMAQRVGGHDGNRPSWHQLAWAGIVTSGARAQLWEAISQHPDKIVAVETDSVASTVPLDLPVSEELGEWELKEYDWITYVQSGIYFAADTVVNKARTRGIDVRELSHPQVLDYMRGLDFKKPEWEQEPLLVSSRQFIGITARNEWNYGQWMDTAKVVRVAGGKRVHLPSRCQACKRRPKNRNTMADTMHDLTAHPLWGRVPSHRHTLPWLDGADVVKDPEAATVTSEAIEEWETPRRIVLERPNG